jgi:hypothetical protein
MCVCMYMLNVNELLDLCIVYKVISQQNMFFQWVNTYYLIDACEQEPIASIIEHRKV